jgi:hypothetical protein
MMTVVHCVDQHVTASLCHESFVLLCTTSTSIHTVRASQVVASVCMLSATVFEGYCDLQYMLLYNSSTCSFNLGWPC